MSSSSNLSSPSSSKHKKMSREELAHKISKLEAKLENIKIRARGHETIRDTEQAKPHVLKKTQETVENQFHKVKDKFKARGFVYSFHLEDGTIVTGASDSLNDWWTGEIQSYQENQEGNMAGTSSIDSNGSSASNDTAPAPEDPEKDESS